MSKSASKKYQKKTQREHVLDRPDTYIGDVEKTSEEMYIYKNDSIIKKNIKYTPGFLKIYDEILVNARDASVNDKGCDTIKVEFNQEENYISVYNNCKNGIPVLEHDEHKTLIPSMIFGEMLTSSNYDDEEKRTTGGKNGLGSKLTNIFSKEFYVEIGDAINGKKFKQTWKNNMLEVEKSKVTKYSKSEGYILVKFYPDLSRFGLEKLDDNHESLFHRRLVDLCISSHRKLKLYYNGLKVKQDNFKKYISLYYPEDSVIFDETNDRWKIGVIFKPDSNQEVISFVNGISTYRGGTHCNHVIDKIIRQLTAEIKKKEKDIKLSSNIIKDNLVFFIDSIIENPNFSSQTKDTLTTKSDKFGSSYKVDEKLIKKLLKSGIVKQVVGLAKFKQSDGLKKNDGKKIIKLRGIPKLEDANKAGSKDAHKCTLILTEGDSAKTFAMSGLSVIGRDYYGVFPLKGKILNVREASIKQRTDNAEVNNIKKILGLKTGVDYTNDDEFNKLRYGRVVALVDSDVDGSHIKGLFMNFMHFEYPSLLKREGFLTSLLTPIVKATKGKDIKVFYNLTDYEKWVENNDTKKYSIKYYKGLGTSTSKEAKDSFTDFDDKLIRYIWYNECDDSIKLAFAKDQSNARKEWLKKYDRNNILSNKDKLVSYENFINKELIHFSNEDVERSIPSIMDGLKPSQRKILYGSFLRKLDKDEVKVSQLAGFVSDKAAYHHGEASLMSAIIGLAQDYMGSNNINLLKPNGQFGSKLLAGKDSASPRYIWTKLEKLTSLIFRPKDNPILNNLEDDGLPIEPEYYAPIIPMVLVNGCKGIGTGFSTTIPSYNPTEIIDNLLNLLDDNKIKNMKPYYNGFRGKVLKNPDTKNGFILQGNCCIKGNKLIIDELPPGEATTKYKEYIENKLESELNKKNKKNIIFNDYKDNNNDKQVYFELNLINKDIKNIHKEFKLESKIDTNNMHLYNKDGIITKYSNIKDIIKEFYNRRLELYKERKNYELDILKNELDMISNKVRFILMIVNKELKINNKKKKDIELKLQKHNFPRIGETYNYLLNMSLYNLTFEKVEELKKLKDTKESEYNKLNKMTEKDIWRNELLELREEYDKWILTKEY